jgi:UDP-glucose 4-epimerase
MTTTSEWAGRRVLVTGGAGFLGSHLTERLVSLGAAVTVLDNLRTGSRRNLSAVEERFRFVEADVRDREAVELLVGDIAPQVVFHLAANPSVPASVKDPVYDYETNAGGTFNVLNAARLADCCEKVVILSSGAVYGEPRSVSIRETDPPRPISPYGASKLHAEVSAAVFHAAYRVPTVSARLFNVYGPRMGTFVVRDLLTKLRQNPDRLEVLGTGLQVREFTYVSDAVEGLVLLAERGLPGETYNLSSGEPITIRGLAELLVSTLGLEGCTQLVCTGQSWPGDAHRWEVCIDKIAALGFRPAVNLRDGLRSMLDE